MEGLRRAVRKVVPYNSTLYRGASEVYNYGWVALKEGPATARVLRSLEREPAGVPRQVSFKVLQYPILARPGTPDSMALITTLVRKDHDYIQPVTAPMTILDAGAYIGDSAAYFLSKYPKASVIALEPENGNYELAVRNLAAYGDRVRLHKKALSTEKGTVYFGGDFDGASISDQGVAVDATSIPELMQEAGWDRIGILKIDIEGAEKYVLSSDADRWLDKVDLLIAEIHGSEIEVIVRNTLTRNGFDMRPYRTSWFCRKVR